MAFTLTQLVSANFESAAIVGGTHIELVYKIKSLDINTLCFYFDYTKDTSTYIEISPMWASKFYDSYTPYYFPELVWDLTTGIATNCKVRRNAAGLGRLILNNIKSEDYLKLYIDTDSLVGNDELKILMVEDNIGGKRAVAP